MRLPFTDRGKYIGRHLLTDEFIQNPQEIGNLLEKLMMVLHKLELYDAQHANGWRVSMPDGWHLLYREIFPYLQVVKKSRKKPRSQRKPNR